MGRPLTSYQLPLRWNREGHLVLSADRIAQGIGFILGSVLWAGLWVVMLLDEPTSSQSSLRVPIDFYLVTFGIAGLGLAIGIRLLFAGTTVTIDREGGTVRWREARLLRTTTTEHDMAEMVMAIHPAEDHRGIGWRGFAVTLIIPPAHLMDVARGKKEERLVEYAAKITEATGIELGWTDAQLT